MVILAKEDRVPLGCIVKGTTEKRIIKTKGFAVNVIDTEQEGLKNIQTNVLLNRSVGVTVRQDGGLGSAVSYNLNGMSGNSVRIFVDDIPISAYGSSFSLNSIPPSLIERIEVYKGVIPSHMTDDAMGHHGWKRMATSQLPIMALIFRQTSTSTQTMGFTLPLVPQLPQRFRLGSSVATSSMKLQLRADVYDASLCRSRKNGFTDWLGRILRDTSSEIKNTTTYMIP